MIGAPFYVMERVEGVVPHEPAVLAQATAETNARCAAAFARVLGDIHAVDIDQVGLGGFARREGFLERQVSRWTDQWARSKSGEQPEVDALAHRLLQHMPVQRETTLVHGDYRLGNVMLDGSDTATIVAVFDWEMATLGDPLTDLAYTVLWWGSDDRPLTHPSQAVADLPGFPSASELVEQYAMATDRSCDAIGWYVALAVFKLAVIGEGQRARRRRTGADVDTSTAQPLAAWALAASDPGRPFAI